ncbi:MAG TPA: rubrerythrin family protein [Elusimicrobiota bacterium]|nr:rubrerythrin family protein [Elusimicrobiota bacterium]
MSTTDNLKAAFAGESQANRKYLAFAKKAESDGFPQIAKLFRAVAEAETVHAHAHLRVLGGVKKTAENIQSAMDGEAYEFKTMYPDFLAESEKEGHRAASLTFKYALAVEKIHHDLYSKALAASQTGKDLETAPIYVCEVCGHTHIGLPEDKCPICGAGKDRFKEIK